MLNIDAIRKLCKELDEIEGRIQADLGRKAEIEGTLLTLTPQKEKPTNGKLSMEERVLELLSAKPRTANGVSQAFIKLEGKSAGVRPIIKQMEQDGKVVKLKGKYHLAGGAKKRRSPPPKGAGFRVDTNRLLSVMPNETTSVRQLAKIMGYCQDSGSVLQAVRVALNSLLTTGQVRKGPYQYERVMNGRTVKCAAKEGWARA